MDSQAIIMALLGGALIGLAASTLLLLNGRIAGISGIFAGVLSPSKGQTAWRLAAVAGMLAGGAALLVLYPAAYPTHISSSPLLIIGGGLAVGFGTRLGSGCTSGHGICGVARLSRRSFAATGTFIASGAVTVWVMRHLIGA